VEELDLKTFLSSPNIVNTCGKQVGPLYALQWSTEKSGLPWLKYFLGEKLFCLIEYNKSHPISVLKLKLFRCKRVERWPVLHWPQVYIEKTTGKNIRQYVCTILRNISPDLSGLANILVERKSTTEVSYAKVDWPLCSAFSPNERQFTVEWLALSGMTLFKKGGEAEQALKAYDGLKLEEGEIRHKNAKAFVHLVKRIVRTKPEVVDEVKTEFKKNPSVAVTLYNDRWQAYKKARKRLPKIPPLKEVEDFFRDKHRSVLMCVYEGEPELGRARLLAGLASLPPGPIVLTLPDLLHLDGIVSLPDNHLSSDFPAYSHLVVDCLDWYVRAKELLIALINKSTPSRSSGTLRLSWRR
jgi:hypothetical protein